MKKQRSIRMSPGVVALTGAWLPSWGRAGLMTQDPERQWVQTSISTTWR